MIVLIAFVCKYPPVVKLIRHSTTHPCIILGCDLANNLLFLTVPDRSLFHTFRASLDGSRNIVTVKYVRTLCWLSRCAW
jgi:hypothetical protein